MGEMRAVFIYRGQAVKSQRVTASGEFAPGFLVPFFFESGVALGKTGG